MAKKIPSRRQSAKARVRSSSSDAHSRNSARKKSKKSSDDSGTLSVRTPQDSPLQFLADAGIIVPEEIPSDEDRVPLDFTALSSKQIGSLQSRYAVRHAHAIFNAAKLAADEAALKRDLRLVKAKFRLHHKGEKMNIVNAMMEEDETIIEIEERLSEVEAKVGILTAVAQGYEDLRNAASREMSRRIGERAQID